MLRSIALGSVAAVALAATSLTAQDAKPVQTSPAKPVFTEDGTVHVPAFDLPPSELSSPQARAAQAMRAKMPGGVPPTNVDISSIRRGLEAMLAPQVGRMREAYPVDVAEQRIAGVPTRIVTPKGKPFDPARVLINLHGGGFSMCADACAMLESAPIAALGGFKVVTVNYRMGPEARHPAAVEDVAAVYRELLKTYKPGRIGIYGCSAGGALTAQAAAWLPSHGLPQAGAIGIFGAGGVRFMTGDSAYVAGYIDGSFPPPPKPGEQRGDMTQGYFAGVQMNDPIVSPALHPVVVAKFPPALIITGTRAMDMSPAIVTNSALVKAGRHPTLIVGEGMGHCYMYQPELPEARDAHQAIVDFFRENLK
ncbi:MAG: alpha/beta hydrolase [Sphingomonadales bacterium]|nr:alpha/beta hydrolase [Sphingomonadales bacterium]